MVCEDEEGVEIDIKLELPLFIVIPEFFLKRQRKKKYLGSSLSHCL